ncbi:multidrug effflux MFS transporter [Methylobacterium sp. 092160098-2]|uniref:multidrug effflux MFS transporter n=1 Tax=Methylobacterium sp. 092160098-2 TaxID=3025129 RepID=UPI002381C3CB|nr:multidrug effflux MFS transporter [Methylobacterium sp. 092160098-2]MDE4909203.1 multidrug effflux MFS transporter [Methylobacterium sp. 092160098-2]
MIDAASVAEAKPGAAPPTTHGWRVLGVLSALMGFASISTDLYLPALPAMATGLGSDAGTMELTVAGYLIGFSLGQLVWGPLGDRHGRRGPVAFGLTLFVLGSAGCAMSGTAGHLVAWRIVQAVGACAGVVLSRAMVRDLYAGHRAASMLSTLMTVMAVAPLLGPLLGGQVLALAGWRAIFWLLVGVGLLTLAALATLPETLPDERRNREPLARAFARYGLLLREPRLLAYAGAGGFFYGGMFAYIAGSPGAYITVHHVSPQVYGLLFGMGILGIMAANLLNARLVRRTGGERLLTLGTLGAALAGLAVALAAWTGWGGLVGLVTSLFLFITATGFIVANSIAAALDTFPERAGAVSALVGSLHYGSGILGAGLVGAFADGTPWPMGLVIALAGIGSASCALAVNRTAAPNR